MDRALYTAATGMHAQQLNIDTIAHNMSNVNTNGYKKSDVRFADLLYQTIKEAGTATSATTFRPTELTVGVGVKPVATQKSFLQGTLVNTGNPLDIAISGDGFFQVTQNDGTIAYTRDGSFKMNDEGAITNSEGLYLEPRINIPSDTESLAITQDGLVMAKLYGTVDPQEVGQIELARFVNPVGLKSAGGNLLLETPASGAPLVGAPDSDSFGKLQQNYLENSNVEIVDEMVNMITAQRSYELNSKVIRTAETMMQDAIQLKR